MDLRPWDLVNASAGAPVPVPPDIFYMNRDCTRRSAKRQSTEVTPWIAS